MKPTSTNKKSSLGSLMVAGIVTAAAVSLSLPASATIIVAENFGGTGANLHATTADTFNAAITTAGGSSAWQAATTFKDDGSVTPVFFNNAYLSMGSYINTAKGTASGLFTLSTTLTRSTTGNWGSIGFFRNPVTTGSDFTTAPGLGLGTLIYRTSGLLSAFVGPGTTTGAINGATVTGPQLLTVVLDLTGHNNIDNFGSVSFYQGAAVPANQIGTTTNFAADYSFDAIGMSQSDYTGTYSGLQLVQIPEPSAALLGGLGLLALLLRRRRAA